MTVNVTKKKHGKFVQEAKAHTFEKLFTNNRLP